MKTNISILGSTGSIGINTLKIIKRKNELFSINILIANKNYNLICKQIIDFKPSVFIINNETVYKKVKNKFNNKKIKIFNNLGDYKNSTINSDITVAAIPGIAGLSPTVKMIKKSKKILLANKESVICGWNLIKKESLKYKTKIIPIDSEHYSIMKLIENEKIKDIKKIYITASGGPFLNYKMSNFKNIKPSDATKHPKWKMGKKISVDSATMMNKVLEVIEAHKIFSIDLDKIKIVIHPESLIHAIIHFKNGLYKFLYHETSMIIPLANAIFEKDLQIDEIYKPKVNKKKFTIFNRLSFSDVDKKRFPMINVLMNNINYESSPIIINAANEILVDQFLKKKIEFNSIYKYLLLVLQDRNYRKNAIKKPKNLDQIFKIDNWSRNTVYEKIKIKKYA